VRDRDFSHSSLACDGDINDLIRTWKTYLGRVLLLACYFLSLAFYFLYLDTSSARDLFSIYALIGFYLRGWKSYWDWNPRGSFASLCEKYEVRERFT